MTEEELFRARSCRSRVLTIAAAHAPHYYQCQQDPANLPHGHRMTVLLGLLQWEFPLKTSRGNNGEALFDHFFVKYSVDLFLRFSM